LSILIPRRFFGDLQEGRHRESQQHQERVEETTGSRRNNGVGSLCFAA
jgi:hypothetical protein